MSTLAPELSEGLSTVTGVHHPWRTFREELAHVRLRWEHLPEGLLGLTLFATSEVLLARGLTQVERRCTIAHESEHVRRGPVPEHLEAREDRAVDAIVARRMISFDDLVTAMVWSRDDVELADELWVDLATVRARLENLTDEETATINQRLDDAELQIP